MTLDSDLHQQLHELACMTARAAAAMVLSRHGELHDADTKASDIDLVTEVDRASEELISKLLLAARPDDGIVGEEGASITSTSGVEWLVDPIDGTTSFFYGLPGFSVSIAARVGDQVVTGCVLAPAITTEYSAVLGQGATMNGDTIMCRDTSSLSKALVGTGFSPDHERRARQGQAFAAVIPHIRDIRRIGSAALDLSAVAAGQLDAYFEIGLSLWDYAAGVLIAAEAGALTVVEPDAASDRAFVLAAAPGIGNDLVALLRAHKADKV
jgi:myo-inositol-1(or 4)-monophosphatase